MWPATACRHRFEVRKTSKTISDRLQIPLCKGMHLLLSLLLITARNCHSSIISSKQLLLDHEELEARQALLRAALNVAGLANYTCRSILSGQVVDMAATELVHRDERLITLSLRLTGCRTIRQTDGNSSDSNREDNDDVKRFIFRGNDNNEEPTSAPITLKQTIVFTGCGAIISGFFLVAAILRFRSRLKKKLSSHRRKRKEEEECESCGAGGGGSSGGKGSGASGRSSHGSRERRRKQRRFSFAHLQQQQQQHQQQQRVQQATAQVVSHTGSNDKTFTAAQIEAPGNDAPIIDRVTTSEPFKSPRQAVNEADRQPRYSSGSTEPMEDDDVISMQPASPLAALASSGCSSAGPASPLHQNQHQQQQQQHPNIVTDRNNRPKAPAITSRSQLPVQIRSRNSFNQKKKLPQQQQQQHLGRWRQKQQQQQKLTSASSRALGLHDLPSVRQVQSDLVTSGEPKV